MRKLLFFYALVPVAMLYMADPVKAQEYKLRQSNSMMGMKSESTVYVKGMRKRTETGPMMTGMPATPVTIEQCDLQRTVKLNDKKKLYFIELYSKEPEEVIDDDVKPATQKTPPKEKTSNQKGGTITMWYNITDTGERKKIYGFTARHLWTYQKIKPSADACTMKDSMIIKTDGWYIDFPQFNCPVRYRPQKQPTPGRPEPECTDKFVSHRSGKGKLGYPLTETRTMIMGNGDAKTSQFETSLETLELTTGKLDSMLFEIPPGYTETKNESDLQDKFDPKAMMKEYEKNNKVQDEKIPVDAGQKKTGSIRIGVYEPKGDGQVQASLQQQNLVNDLRSDKVESIAVTTEQEAREKNCDYVLNTDFTKVKQASKVGGLLKAIKNTDPNAASSFNISATLTLVTLADGSTKTQQKVDGKYDGKVDDAAKRALDEGSNMVLKALK